ncbi:hypothetical protein D9M69_709110 [compost metagenome]
MLGDEVAELADELRALGRGQAGPLGEGGLGGGHGGVHFGLAARGDFGQHFLRGGVDGFEVVGALDWLAVDEVMDLLHGREGVAALRRCVVSRA